MKILLSWLNDYGDFGDPTERRRRAARRRRAHLARPRGRLDRRRSATRSTASSPRASCASNRIPTRRRSSACTSTPVTARSATSGVVPTTSPTDDIVPLATLGTTMPNGMTIERRGILGIDSEGMLCSAQELGLGDDHSGIRVLPAGTPARRAVRRGARDHPRRADRRRCHAQPSGLLGVRGHRPRPGGEDGRRVPAADTDARRHRRGTHHARSSSSTATVAPVSRRR